MRILQFRVTYFCEINLLKPVYFDTFKIQTDFNRMFFEFASNPLMVFYFIFIITFIRPTISFTFAPSVPICILIIGLDKLFTLIMTV